MFRRFVDIHIIIYTYTHTHERKVIEFEQFIENIPDAEEREMVKLYFIDLLSYEQIGERFYLERTTIARRIKKYIDAMPYFTSQKTEQAG